jgi:LysM repeat protein
MDNAATAPDVTTYKIATGDTFSRVAKRYKLSVAALMALNKAKGDALQIGDVVFVPVAR